jgi:hypothetical protein
MASGAVGRRGVEAWIERQPWTWALRAVMAAAVLWTAACSASVKDAESARGGYSYSWDEERQGPAAQMAPAPYPPPPPPAAPPPEAEAAGSVALPVASEGAPPAESAQIATLASQIGSDDASIQTQPTQAVVRQPLLIYTATLRLAVYQAESGLAKAEKIALDAGGYLVRRDNLSIVVRVPAARFKKVLHAMEQLGDVTGREIQAEDVTDEFFDLDTRLRNARAMRDRLEQLLGRANSVEDALKVEQELGRLTGEIERIEGRLKLLKELLAFSTVKLEFQPRRTEVVSSRVKLPFPWLDELGLGRLLNLGGEK